jgi:hypothetical protein
MKKLQKNPYSTFASVILSKEQLVKNLNNNQINILKKAEQSKIKTVHEKGYLTKTISNVHKLSERFYF